MGTTNFDAVAASTFTGNLVGNVTGTTTGAVSGTTVSASAFFDESAAAALTAAGTTRTDALALTAARNQLTTVATGKGVVMPASATVGVGGHVVIYNAGAQTLKVYAAGSDTIDGTAGSTGVSLAATHRCEYFVIATGAFISAQLGATSA